MKSVFQRYLLNFYWDTASESIRRVSCMAAARTGKRRYFSHPVQRAYWKKFYCNQWYWWNAFWGSQHSTHQRSIPKREPQTSQ